MRTGLGRPVRQKANTRASALLTLRAPNVASASAHLRFAVVRTSKTPRCRETDRRSVSDGPGVIDAMTVDLEQAKGGDERAFASLVEPFRRELQLHCYRLLGSVQDAEDLVQETLLAAWRGLNGFEERASLRSWLYRIATHRSLNAIRERGRRPATENTMRPSRTRRAVEPSWLEPYADSALPDPAPGPEARYEQREAIGVYLDNGAEVRGAPLQVRPTRANGQPAFGCYLRSQPWGMMVLTLSGSKVDQITFFADPALPGRFGLPEHI